MWIPLHFWDTGLAVSAVLTPSSQWRVMSYIFGVVLCCLRVVSLQESGPDISNMAAYTGKLFYVSLGSHPVYGSPDVNIQLAAMSESADDQFPAWLWFNSSSRSLSGVPLPGDEGLIHLTISATCAHISGHPDIHTATCVDRPTEVFELTISTCPWTSSQVPAVSVASPVADVETAVSSPGCGVGQAMAVEVDCEGARVVASLVLCSTSGQLTSRDRMDLMLHLSEFLTIPVSSITLEPSSTHLLTAIKKGFHMVSAGPGLDDACHMSHNMEVLWWLPCATVKHLNDFIRVLQHNVDGGRLQREIGATIVGWYVASSNPLVTRQSRRRRAAGYRTVVPTPVLSPLKPTSIVASAQVDSVVTSSADLPRHSAPMHLSSSFVPRDLSASIVPTERSSHVMLFTTDYPVIFPESLKQTETDISPSTLVSEPSSLFRGNFAEMTKLSSVSRPSPSADVTSSSSSTEIISLQLLTQPPWTPQLWEQHHLSTEQWKPDATFSYLSTPNYVHRHFISSPSTPDLAASYVRRTSDLSSTVTTQYHHELNSTRSSLWQPVLQSPVDPSISSVAADTADDLSHWQPVLQSLVDPALSSVAPATVSDVSSWRPRSPGGQEHASLALVLVEDARSSSSLLYPSSTSTDWLQESETASSSSPFIEDIPTGHPPKQLFSTESTTTPDLWLPPLQMSDTLTLFSSFASLSMTSAYLVLSRDVQVIAPGSTSAGSVFGVDLWTDKYLATSYSTSATPETVTYFDGSDLHGKYNSPAIGDAVWDPHSHAHSNIPILPTQHSFPEQPRELDQLPRWSSVPQLSRLSQSAWIQTQSHDSSMPPLYPQTTSERSAPETAVEWEFARESNATKISTMMTERDDPELVVVTSIVSPAGDSSKSFNTSVSSLDTLPSAGPRVHGDKRDQSTVTTASSATVSHSDTTGVAVNTTSVTTPGTSPVLFFTSAATKRPRPRTTTSLARRGKTTAATVATTTTTTTTTITTTTTTTTTTERASTRKRPSVRKPSTHKVLRTTQMTTPGWDDEDDVYPDYFNNRPYVQRPIKVIRADQGKQLEFMIPHDVFYDIEDGDTRHLSLSLELPDNQVLPDNFWLYMESAEQVIKALPLHEDMDVKNMSVILVARDKQGLAAADDITLQIDDTPRRSFTHVFRMKFAIGFLQFMHSRRNITQLLERIGSYFHDEGAQLITVLEVRQGSFIMSWTNNSLTGATCPSETIRQLYAHMVRRDGAVRQTFSRHIGRHLHLKEVQLQPWGACVAPVSTTTAASTSTSTKSTSTHLASEVKASHGFSVWAHVILPVLIAVLVFILIILIIIFCNRRHRQQQANVNAEKEVISNDANPVIFPSECATEDLLSKPRDPQLLPAADLQPNQNMSAGSSQVKNNLNRDQERARKSRDNRETEWLNKDAQISDQESERDWSRNVHRKHAKDSISGRRHRDTDRTSRVSASSTLSWDRPNNHYLEEEAGSRSSTLKSTKSAGSDKRHCRSPPPYWQHQTDPPPYRMPPPYLSNNSTLM